jgi:branched-chain amino acid transport system permease protein
VYAGVLFILMVTFAPGGIAGLVMMHQPIWRAGRLGRLAAPYARLVLPSLLVAVGFVLAIELCSFLTIGAAQGKSLTLSGVTVNPRSGTPWIAAALLLAVGGLWMRVEMRRVGTAWDALAEEIKTMGARA